VSPWVQQGGVSHVIYDHTSALRTILLRFFGQSPIEILSAAPAVAAGKTAAAKAPNVARLPPPGGGGLPPHVVPSMGARTDNANDLGALLSLAAPRAATPIGPGAIVRKAAVGTESPVSGIGATIRLSILRL
jgi:hypothetical protein